MFTYIYPAFGALARSIQLLGLLAGCHNGTLSQQYDQADQMNGLGRGLDQDGFIEEQVRTDRLHQLLHRLQDLLLNCKFHLPDLFVLQ